MRLKTKLILAAGLIAATAPAIAHRQWMVPSATIFSGKDDWVTVDAAISNDLFFPDHFPMQLDGVKVWQPDGQPGKIENGATGRYRSTFDVHLDKPGTWKIGTVSSGVSGSFKVDGTEWRVGGRRGPPPAAAGAAAGAGAPARPAGAPPAGGPQGGPGGPGGPQARPSVATVAEIPANATDVKITESSGKYEIFVTTGAPTDTVYKPANKGLEMVPVTHPAELVAKETAKLKFLVDGKPAANLKVTVIPGGKRYRDGEDGLELTTGADGVLAVTWPTAGMYWLNTTTSDKNVTTPRATDRRLSYTATLEVMAP
jgi:hypothetical protein